MVGLLMYSLILSSQPSLEAMAARLTNRFSGMLLRSTQLSIVLWDSDTPTALSFRKSCALPPNALTSRFTSMISSLMATPSYDTPLCGATKKRTFF
jgi:hypothetical protein